jgi:hypothetical protein
MKHRKIMKDQLKIIIALIPGFKILKPASYTYSRSIYRLIGFEEIVIPIGAI